MIPLMAITKASVVVIVHSTWCFRFGYSASSSNAASRIRPGRPEEADWLFERSGIGGRRQNGTSLAVGY